MKSFSKVIIASVFLGAMLSCAFGDSMSIERDGIHKMKEKFPVNSQGQIYEISGSLEASGIADKSVFLNLGLIPNDALGKPMNGEDRFPLPIENLDDFDGFLVLEQLEIFKDGPLAVKMKVLFEQQNIDSVSFVAESALAEGVKIELKDFTVTPVGTTLNSEAAADGGPSSDGNTAGKLASYAYVNGRNILADNESVGSKNKKDAKENALSAGSSPRYIYVNPDFGSDKFQGFKRLRGQVDGPKRTFKSALNKAENGDVIVLQESESPHILNGTLKTEPGRKLVIRAEGNVKIKSN